MKSLIRKISLILCILSLFLILIPIKITKSNEDDLSLITPVRFQFSEDSTTEGFYNNSNYVDVNLPSAGWEVKDIELNFSKIEFEPEIKNIEGDSYHDTYKRVYNKNPAHHLFGLAVQMVFNTPTLLYGLYLYGYNLSHPGIPQLQIRGFDALENKPNADLYLSTDLSFNSTPGWQLQNFSSPIFLYPGNYSLVIDGTSLPSYAIINEAGFYWAYNSIDPINSQLYVSEYNSSEWIAGSSGAPFLHKLIQKFNTSIYPEEINMTAELDGKSYHVLNGNTHGKGYLKRQNINFKANKNKVLIEVKNNSTNQLKFDFNYKFTIFNHFAAPGLLRSKINESNEWSITPNFIKLSDDQQIHFTYPSSWSNLKVYKNQQDVSTNVIFYSLNHSITIPSTLIENGAQWEVLANSPIVNFNLTVPKTDFDVGQELRFSVSKVLPGNYTWVLLDPIGLEKYRTVRQIPSDSKLFTYEIPSHSLEGVYKAYILWNNETDAGMVSQSFFISKSATTNPGQDFSFFYILGFIIAGAVIIGGSSYVTIRKVESKRKDKLQRILEQCNDIMNVRHIIVLDIKTGIDLYSKSFEKKELEPTLISGFLHAIHNFGVEVIAGAKNSKTVKVEYKDSIIIMTEFINLRLIIIMNQHPSENFFYSIESLAYHIYKYYGKLIDNFKGNLKPFRGMGKLVESDLNISLLYPLTISLKKDMKLTQDEKDMVKKAKKFMNENNFPYFYFLYLIPENACKPRDYQVTLQLIKKGIFVPLEKQEYMK
jgi:hypothetical protein